MKVSVVVPCYNVEKYIDRCLESIERQTIGMDSLEIILINDCSGDDTFSHLREFEQKYTNNTILVDQEEHYGVSAARNIGLEYASGDYITFIDADDYVADCMIERMVDVIVKEDCDMVECDYVRFENVDECGLTGDNTIKVYDFAHNDDDRRDYIVNNSLKCALWGRLYNTDFIKKNELLCPDGLLYEDVYFTGIAMFLYNKACRISETMYYYFSNSSGIVQSTANNRIREETVVFRKMLEELDRKKVLDDILKNFYDELEYYCFRKSFCDPISMLSLYNLEDYSEDTLYFKNNILEIFPKVSQNKYALHIAKRAKVFEIMINLLK